MRIWPFKRKSKQVTDSYNGEISIDEAVKLISREIGGVVGSKSESGQLVTEQTAMRFSAVYACVSLLAGTIAGLSCEVFRRIGDDERELANDHPAFRLLHDEPNPAMSAYVFWETEGSDCYLSGNSYALIGRRPNGIPTGLYWLPSSAVTPFFNPDYTRILYRVSLNGRETRVYDQDDILHFPCIGWDGLKGLSPIGAARESIGLGLAGEQYNARYFANAITSDIAILFKKGMTPEALKEFRESMQERYGGSKNARVPLILKNEADIKSLRMNADDAQMMVSRSFQIEDVCRFYGVPPHLVGAIDKESSWGKGVEEQTLGFIKFTLRRRVKMKEQEINRKLIDDPQYYVKFNMDDLLRGDIKTRADFYKVALGGNQIPGFMTTNEARKLENMKPLEGDQYDRPYDPAEANSGETDQSGEDNQPRQPQRRTD